MLAVSMSYDLEIERTHRASLETAKSAKMAKLQKQHISTSTSDRSIEPKELRRIYLRLQFRVLLFFGPLLIIFRRSALSLLAGSIYFSRLKWRRWKISFKSLFTERKRYCKHTSELEEKVNFGRFFFELAKVNFKELFGLEKV